MTEKLNIEGLRQQTAVKTLERRNGSTLTAGAPLDPLAQALRDRRAIMGQKLTEQTVHEASADALAAETRRLEMELRKKELDEKLHGAGPGGGVQEMVLEELRSTREQVNALQDKLNQAQMGALQERIDMLSAKLAEVQQAPVAAPPPDALSSLSTMLDQHRAVTEQLQSLMPAPAAAPVHQGGDNGMMRTYQELKRLDAERENTRLQLEHQRWLAERDDKREALQAELALKREEMEQRNRFMAETAPRLIDLGTQILQRLMAGVQAPAAPFAPAAMPQAAPTVPPGVKQGQCQQCGTPLFYSEAATAVACQVCGAEYGITPDPEGNGA